MAKKYDVIVVGGGIIGCAVTYYLEKRGKHVLLLEKADHAAGSAGATDGVVSYHTKKPGHQMELAIRSLKLFDGLEDELGESIEYVKNCGGMQPAENKAQWDMLCHIAEEQRKSGADIQMITIAEARKMEPQLADDLYGVLYAPCGCKVEPIRLTMAFLHAAKRLGAEVKNHTGVRAFLKDGAGRICGVETDKGETYEAPACVLSCGSWSCEVGKLADIDLPVKPRRGQLMVTEPIGEFMHCTLQCALYNVIKFMPESIKDPQLLKLGASLSIHQTKDGGLLIGGTREWAGFDRFNSLEAIEAIARRVLRFFPAVGEVSVIRTFAGLRPYTPDGMCCIGPSKKAPGLYVASGHEGDGIALAPITGVAIAELICDGKTDFDISPFSPDRFGEQTA